MEEEKDVFALSMFFFKMLTVNMEHCGKHVLDWRPCTTFLEIAPPPYPHRYCILIGSGIGTQYELNLTQFSQKDLKYDKSIFSFNQVVLLNGREVNWLRLLGPFSTVMNKKAEKASVQ